MYHFNPKVVNTRDSQDDVPIIPITVPEYHPLAFLMHDMRRAIQVAEILADWPEPPGDNYDKRIPGSAFE